VVVGERVPGLTLCPLKRPEEAIAQRGSNRTVVRSSRSASLKSEVAYSKNRGLEKMKKIQPRDSKQRRGWPPKKMMAGWSGKVFSLDFLFIEQPHATERAKRIS